VAHLVRVRDAWAPERAGNYRAQLVAAPPEVGLGRAFRGLALLAGPELSGERLTVALETKDQEDEHSCFSDNTHNDVVFDVQGLRDAYLGLSLAPGAKATAPARDSLHGLVLGRDAALAQRVEMAAVAALDAARAIPPPFDQAIRGADDAPGRVAVRATAIRLRALSDAFASAAAALGARVDG
jgi:putative iron-regulated protein